MIQKENAGARRVGRYRGGAGYLKRSMGQVGRHDDGAASAQLTFVTMALSYVIDYASKYE
jgi:hypothetical protein